MAERSAPLRARFGGVRVRTTIAAVLVVGVALALGAVALVVTMRDALVDDVRSVTRSRAEEVAVALEAGERPSLAVAEADEQVVQVLAPGGEVLAASANAEGWPPIARLAPGESTTVAPIPGEGDFVAVAAGASTRDGPVVVVVARSAEDVLESVEVVTGLLAAGAPLLLLLVGATTWWVVGRALAPVESIRTEVEAISATELHRRVPDPPGSDEVARLATTMNAMLARLEAGLARQRRLVADASHELRSPIASMRQHAEVARAHPERSSLAGLADTVHAETLRVQRLVDDLLVLARVDERGLGLRRRPVDLDDLVFDEAARLRAGAAVRVDVRRVSAGRVVGDADALRRVVRNLVDNAARHAATTVTLALTHYDETVELVVEDDGPGVPEPERSRVFERFVRLDESRARADGGAGLGLPIVAELVAAHGGAVVLGEAERGGARFEVRLPSEGMPPPSGGA